MNETLKKALISILIGAGIAFLSTVLEGLLHYVQALDLNPAAMTAGVIYYLKSWKSSQIG